MADNDQQDFNKALDTFRQQQDELHAQQRQFLEQQQMMFNQMVETQKKASRKDLWDRLGAIAPILSGTIIAIGGTFFTLNYNQQQLKLQEAQTIERFIPHLLGDEKSKRAAILAISSLTDPKLAAKVASIFASPGTVSALESIAENDTGSGSDRKALKSALARTLDNMAGNFVIEKRYDDAIATSQKALALQEQSFGVDSPELVPNLNRIAELFTIHKDYPGAEATLKRSADIQKASFGADSMEFASELRRLSALYKEQGLDSKSQSIMNQAIAIEQKAPATKAGGGIGVASELRTDSADHGIANNSDANSASPDKSLAHGTDKTGHSTDLQSDPHTNPLTPPEAQANTAGADAATKSAGADRASSSTSAKATVSAHENGASAKSGGTEHSGSTEKHGQELPNKSYDSEAESQHSRETSSNQAGQAY